MRKFAASIIAFIYMTASSGATIEMHYCMGKFVSSKTSHGCKVEKCSKCGMNKSLHKGCCKDEKKKLTVSDQKISTFNFLLKSINATLAKAKRIEVVDCFESSAVANYEFENPPPLNIPIFIINCVYRI